MLDYIFAHFVSSEKVMSRSLTCAESCVVARLQTAFIFPVVCLLH